MEKLFGRKKPARATAVPSNEIGTGTGNPLPPDRIKRTYGGSKRGTICVVPSSPIRQSADPNKFD